MTQATDQIVIETQTLPPVEVIGRLLQSGMVWIECQENYQKRSYRNKFKILGANGPLTLTIPLLRGKNKQMKIHDVRISYDQNWPDVFRNNLQSAYGKSPFYMHYEAELFKILDSGLEFLLELNMKLLHFVNQKTGTGLVIKETEEYLTKYSGNYCDLRNCFNLKEDRGLLHYQMPAYPQVFEYKSGFVPGLCILDLLFNTGNEALTFLKPRNFEPDRICK